MRKIFGFVGGLAASTLFGWLGSKIGFMTGFFLGTIAGGFGMYYGARYGRSLEG